MKKMIKYFLFLLMFLMVLVCEVACGEDVPDVDAATDTNDTNSTDANATETSDMNAEERLSFKTMEVKADFFEVAWESVEGAAEYAVEIDGKEYRTKETSYPLFEHIRPSETKTINVTAIVDGVSIAESAWGQVEYTAEGVTEGLTYTKLHDGSYSVYCPSNAIPENGELVLPDKYEEKNITSFRSEKSPSSFILNKGIKSVSDYDGPAYTGISKVRLPAYLSSISDGALYKASISKLYIPNSVTNIGNSAFEGCENLCEITLSSTLKRIETFAFSDCTSLTSIEIPDSVTNVGVGAFARSGLTKIEFPIGVTRIEAYTFYGCTALGEIVYKSLNLATMGTEAFHNTLWYNSQPDGMVCYRIFLYDYKGEMPANTSLIIPENIKRITDTAMFKDETNLVAVTLPAGLLTIPHDTFSGCTNLKQVILSEGLESIESGAFYSCPIEQIILPESLTILGDVSTGTTNGPFENCTKLTSIIIPGKVTTMGRRCFYGCTNLASVTIMDGVTRIGEYSFAHCTALKELILPESIAIFYLTSVAYTGVTSLIWPKNLREQLYYTLKSDDGIANTYLIIQKGTKFLDLHFFYRCTNLKTFFFTGTEKEWEKVEIKWGSGGNYDGLSQEEIEEIMKLIETWQNNLTVYFYSETEPTEEGNYWHYVDGLPVKW